MIVINVNKIIASLMFLTNNKVSVKASSIFPYSSYLGRSGSPGLKALQESDLQKEEQDLKCFVQGWAVREISQEVSEQKKVTYKIFQKQSVVEQVILRQPKERKTIYRTKRSWTNHSTSPVKKSKSMGNKYLQTFYRYQILSLINLLNRRDDYTAFLRGKEVDLLVRPSLTTNQVEQRLKKQSETKGKDKGRVKFNYATSDQLRSVKYKIKACNMISNTPTKKSAKVDDHGDEDEEEGEVEEYTDYKMDMQTWKRKNGVGFYQKVFIVKGGYYEIRRTLLQKGWYENEDVWSPHFDFKWTTKICDINYYQLKSYQSVNHFNNNHHLTSKYGLTRRLRTLILGHGIDVDRFYPRCFDLGDQVDFENFVENFKFGFAESVAKRFLEDKDRYRGLELKIRVIVDILRRRSMNFTTRINAINRAQFPVITPEEWQIITETAHLTEQQQAVRLKQWRKRDTDTKHLDQSSELYEQQLYGVLDERIRDYLEGLSGSDPQIEMNGFRNVWIAKPNFMSRGRGIRCYNNLYDIIDYCLGGTGQFVIQKYIEDPLLIEGKKFDIRVWVLIQDFCPPKIWVYKDCYIRFCADDFSLDNINNRHIHLTNNSVQKYHKKGNIEKSMWEVDDFIQYIGGDRWKILRDRLYNIIVWSVRACEGCVSGRKGTCQMVGYDFMVDQHYNPWLIQINMSPSMEHSTPVTKKLVKRVLHDTVKVITGGKKPKDTGAYTCLYSGPQDADKYSIYNI